MEIKDRARKIKMLLLDVDGVLTDGRVIYDSQGNDIKSFDVQDGLGVYLLKKSGIKTILITARSSRSIAPRAKEMQVEEVFENAFPKLKIYKEIKERYKLDDSEICYVGDDLADLCIMKRAGFSVSVSNACEEVKASSHYVTKKSGGKGAVREVAQLLLKSQDKWDSLIEEYNS